MKIAGVTLAVVGKVLVRHLHGISVLFLSVPVSTTSATFLQEKVTPTSPTPSQ